MPLHATQGEVRPRAIGYRQNVVLFEKTAMIPATPRAVLIDEEIDLGPYGLVATTARHMNLCFFIEKPDGNGGWVVTNKPRILDGGSGAGQPNGLPPEDPPGYSINVDFWAAPMQRPHLPGGDPHAIAPDVGTSFRVGQDAGRDVTCAPDLPQAEVRNRESDLTGRLRVYAFRGNEVYSPEEQATIDALGYRVRVYIECADACVWEREVSIGSAAAGEVLLNEELDLSRFGMITDEDRFVFIADVRRNGKVIRAMNANGYMTGEAFDPPAPPVALQVFGVVDDSPWWNEQNQGSIFGNGERYGKGGTAGRASSMALWGGTWLGPSTGSCSESIQQRLRVLAWRSADPVLTEYVDGSPGRFARYDASGFMLLRSKVEGAPGNYTLEGIYDGPMNVVDSPTGLTLYAQIGDRLGDLIDLIAATGKFDVLYRNDDWIIDSNTMWYWWSTPTPGVIPQFEPLPVPVGSQTGTTVRLRLLVAPPNRVWSYPYDDVVHGYEHGVRQVLFQPDQKLPRHQMLGLHMREDHIYVGGLRVPIGAEAPVVLAYGVGTGSAADYAFYGHQPSSVCVVPLSWPAGSDFSATTEIIPSAEPGNQWVPGYVRVTATNGVAYRVDVFY